MGSFLRYSRSKICLHEQHSTTFVADVAAVVLKNKKEFAFPVALLSEVAFSAVHTFLCFFPVSLPDAFSSSSLLNLLPKSNF